MFNFNFDSIYLVYLLVGLSIGFLVEGVYLLFFRRSSYRKNINRRLRIGTDKADQQSVLIQLRRERGLTGSGEYRLPLISLNKLMVQSGLSIGWGKFIVFIVIAAVAIFGGLIGMHWSIGKSLLIALSAGAALPFGVLKFLRARRIKNFGALFADALDIIVRSLRAGHPVPVAINTVSREMPDPVGTEFGIVSDEITYGADLETAIRDLYYRVGSEDLPLFVTAVAIQNASGGNLGEILENLSSVIRQRFKMRRKVRALAAEGRASALILASLPIGIFCAIQLLVPGFYGSVWHEQLTNIGLIGAGCWMSVGVLLMYKMVNFKI